MRKLTALLFAAFTFTACLGSKPCPVGTMTPFNSEWAKADGSATVEGQAFLQTRGGMLRYASGGEILLIPASGESRGFLLDLAKKTKCGVYPWTSADQLSPLASIAGVRRITADAEGRFKFEKVPAGSWLILARISWEVPGRFSSSFPQGGILMQEIEAKEGATVQAPLSGANLIRIWG